MTTILIVILASLVLLRGALRRIPGIGSSLERFAGWLVPFEIALGVIAILLGLLELLSLEGLLLILAGIVLAVSALQTIPSIGPSLGRLGRALAQFRYILGAILLAVGIFDILSLLFGTLGRFR